MSQPKVRSTTQRCGITVDGFDIDAEASAVVDDLPNTTARTKRSLMTEPAEGAGAGDDVFDDAVES
ncbi:hypothetical protein SO3561_09755 [Streptomyces olivochromogenes]|uniref:Uncharacterized protein n=1 Tax=Streptomyces olivochromogenes TaxID=1963 RepID=A0A250VVN4_STROL|nr:hypothetical protein SO3561_09755 [Streptomyces olivochromogenes]